MLYKIKRSFIRYTGLTILCAALAMPASAQIGPEIGLNMADLSLKNNGNTVHTGFKPGVGLGLSVDIPFSDHVYFQPGIFYEMTGCKITDQPTGKYNINTLTFPLNFEYKTGEKCGKRFFFGGGPFIGVNNSASYDFNDYGAIPSVSGVFKIGSTANVDNLKQIDYGLGVNVGYILRNHLYARLHYQLGLAELNPAGNDKNSIKSSGAGITIGFLFVRCGSSRTMQGFKRTKSDHWKGVKKLRY